MYEYLEGELVRQTATTLVLDVGGVGYSLMVPVGSRFEGAPRSRAWTHLVVREDAHSLYGFPSARQRDLFRLLLCVRGVGPSAALSLLSGLSAEVLVEAILTEQAGTLCRIKGVGKKTAEQILLDLRDRVTRLVGEPAFSDLSPSAGPAEDERLADAVSALLSIGYKEKEAQKLVERAAKDGADLDVEGLVRQALRS